MIEDTGCRDFYSSLFHRTAEFNTLPEYEHKDIKDKLDALEDFDRISPWQQNAVPSQPDARAQTATASCAVWKPLSSVCCSTLT